MQMLCEWAQVSGQPWEERIAEWLDGIGCDAWVMKGLTQYPEEYAQHRIPRRRQDTGRDQELYDGYMAYYRSHQVEAIHDGMIVMRRRSGKQLGAHRRSTQRRQYGDLGELILSTFAAHDLLLEMESDEALLAIKPNFRPTCDWIRFVTRPADVGTLNRLPCGWLAAFLSTGNATAGGGVPGDLRRHAHRRASG